MNTQNTSKFSGAIPAKTGVGLKADYYTPALQEAEANNKQVAWFEVHPENYMQEGGPSHRYLTAIREHYPLSLHGVGLSIGAPRALDKTHLQHLKNLVQRYEPSLFSEHLAWSTHDTGFFNDLLPVPYTLETAKLVVEHVHQVQEFIGRQMLLENPSTYVQFASSTMSEIEFITYIAKHSGCGLLLDVNNVHISAQNHNYSAAQYLDEFPNQHVKEIHLAGHDIQEDDVHAPLLIDSHDRLVADPVWALYERLIAKTGAVPTLIEWDADLPTWEVLKGEAAKADYLLARTCHLDAAE